MNAIYKYSLIIFLAFFTAGCGTSSGDNGSDIEAIQITNTTEDGTQNTDDTSTNTTEDNTQNTDDTSTNTTDDGTQNTDDTSTNTTEDGTQNTQSEKYSYIPKGDQLTYSMAYRFLNLTTFGATKEDVEELRRLGVIKWVDRQLGYGYNATTDSLTYACLAQSKYINPDGYNHPINYYLKEDTTQSIPPRRNYPYAFREYFFSNWFRFAVDNPKQLRLRVAYALSQIIVAADSNYIFGDRYSALSAYYDLLIKYAFGNYGDLLKDISTNPAMGYYLTFYGNRKKYKNSKGEWVYPDENYAREIMQLFSMGPVVLNNDGTKYTHLVNGIHQPVTTYTQKDVNELARVFTGLDFRLRKSGFGQGGYYRGSDTIHKMECFDEYHDSEEKTVLGQTIPAGGDCYSDIDKAVDILMQQKNVAPFIVKKLILRLTKSNPQPDYINRVVKVFNDNGNGVKGDLKAVVKAILLDKELWEKNNQLANLQSDKSLKFKEPLLALTQIMRILHSKPMPKWHITMPDNSGSGIPIEKTVQNQPFYLMGRKYETINQGPAQAQSVFGFYSDDYVPSDSEEFANRGLKAPEIQIQSDGFFPSYNNYLENVFLNREKNYILNPYGGPGFKKFSSLEEYGMSLGNNGEKFILDMGEYYKLAEDILKQETGKNLDDSIKQKDPQLSDAIKEKVTRAIVEKLNQDFLGGLMSEGMKDYFVKEFNDRIGFPKMQNIREFHFLYLEKMIQMLVTSDEFMVE